MSKQIDIFVFGSNEKGIHGAGAALHARRYFGAKPGIGFGLEGRSFAIPTKSTPYATLPLATIADYVRLFLNYATQHPEMRFLLTKIGCGLAGYTEAQIAPLFAGAPDNVVLVDERREVIGPASAWGQS